MMPRSGASGPGRFMIPAAALLLCAVQLAATLPGELNADSTEQLRQAMAHQFGDWHPPVMALVWSWLLDMTGRPGSLLVMQQALHWLGFGLLADGCFRANMPRRAWLLLAAGAFPLFLFYDKVLVKDVEMGAAFVAAFGLCCRFLLLRRSIPAWAMLLAGLLLAYGTLTRTNSVFALGPLVCLLFETGRRLGLTKLVGLSALVALLALPLSNAVNHRLIGATPQDSLQSLQLFDLVGIAVRSGDERVLGGNAPALSRVKECYTAYWWDPLSPWGECGAVRRSFEYVADMRPVSPDLLAERAALWRRAIAAHPLDYAWHRLAYFNSSIYFIVPALHFRFSKSATAHAVSQHDLRMDYLKKNFLFWPVIWLAVGCGALAFLPARPDMPATAAAARLAIVSGLLYSGAYLLIGVATDVRYYYWPILSILVGVLLAFPDLRSQWRARPHAARTAGAVLAAVLLAGYAARLSGVPFV